MNKKFSIIRRVFFILLVAITVFGMSYSSSTVVDASGEKEYLKKGNGSYLTYRGSNGEKVQALTKYDNPIQEFRACWISHFAGDVHSYTNEEAYKTELTEILDNMEKWGMNAMMFHIRTHNNAFYPSKLNPVARWYGNVKFDEFDPVAWLIEECHKRGIEFHAWMNPYRIDDSNIMGTYPEGNPANDPTKILSNGSGKILDPASQEVRDFIVDTCMEVIEMYDVDAIHFDDYFYISGVATHLSSDQKRAEVDKFIEQLHNEMTDYNEETGRNVQLGISPSGIYRNGSYASKPTYDENGNLVSPVGSNTSGMQHYEGNLFSDTLHWINQEWIDYITPQSYWGLEMSVAGYAELTRWWSWAVANKDVNLYMGMGIYMAIENSGSWNNDVNEVDKQLRNAAMYEEIDGICVYKYASLLNSQSTVKKGVETLEKYWGTKRVPSSVQRSYADKIPSYPATNLCLLEGQLTWDARNDVRGYMVYKVPAGTKLDKNNIDHLLEYTQDTKVFANDTAVYDYYVSTVNKANVISEPVKLQVNNDLEAHDIVVTRISLLPKEITLNEEIEVNNIFALYNSLTDEEKTKVINYQILVQAKNTIDAIKSLETSVSTYLNSIDKDLTTGTILTAPENMRWNYKNASDSAIYNLTTGKLTGTYLGRKVVLTLTATVPNSSVTHVVDVEFNASIIPLKYIPLIYRNDASCMTPNDVGEFNPNASQYIGWSNVILYVGNYALPIAVNSYQEVTSVSELKKVHWTSCGALITNKSNGSISFSLIEKIFESETQNYGHFIIGSNGKIKSVSDTTDYKSQITLGAGESIFVTRYLERIIDKTPFTALETNFNTSTEATIIKYEESSDDTNLVELVIDVIDQLPENITLSDETTVNSVLEFYNSLTKEQQSQVTNYSKLQAAVSKIKTLKEEYNKLQTAKNNATTTINNYVKLSNYSAINQASIKGYIQIYLAEVETATTITKVEEIVKNYKDVVDNIKPLTEELVEAKTNAKLEIRRYLDLEEYTENGISQINAIYKSGDIEIDKALGFDQLNEIVNSIKNELDAVLNKEEEFESLKEKYREEIYTYYSESDYSSNIVQILVAKANSVNIELSQITTFDELENAIQRFKDFINDYIKISEKEQVILEKQTQMTNKIEKKYLDDERVQNLLTEYKNQLNNVTTKSAMDVIIKNFEIELNKLCEIIDRETVNSSATCKNASSALISLFGAMSLVALVLRKKR